MRYLLLFFVFLSLDGKAHESVPPKKTICLNMIVKNESGVIEKCLNSVKPLIDYWVIVDTGSNDRTQEIIKKVMKDIPGELHEKPWVNFAHNRNEALALAKNKGDYLLLIDADEVLDFDKHFSLPTLDKDFYFILVRQIGTSDAKRKGLINHHLNWKWEGVIHEEVQSSEAKTAEVLKGVINLCNTHNDGMSGRSKQSAVAKYLRDAEVLERAILEEPNNSRYMYYLGISYTLAEKYDLAKKSFEKRLTLPSRDTEETYYAYYNLGVILNQLNNLDEALDTFLKAYAFRPTRAEPLLLAAQIYRKKGNFLLGYLLAQYGLTHPYPENDNCVQYPVYDHALLIEFSNCALFLGKFKEGFDACSTLLANPHLPAEYKDRLLANLEFARSKMEIQEEKQ